MSDRATVLLTSLQNNLHGWLNTIKRGTGATSVELIPVPDGSGEFSIEVIWDKAGERKSVTKVFTRAYVFGDSMRLSPLAWTVQRRACDHARDVMREVLTQLGVL